MSRPQANAKIMVDDADFERAQNLMIEWETTDPDVAGAIIRCPQCGSSNIEYPQMTRKFLTPALVGLLCAIKIIPKSFTARIVITLGATRKSAPSAGSGTGSSRPRGSDLGFRRIAAGNWPRPRRNYRRRY